MIYNIYENGKLTEKAKALYQEERQIKRLDGWFIAKETEMLADEKYADCAPEVKKANLLCEVLKNIPISLSENAVFAGVQRDAFAKSYALINPSFTVEGFSGYCDPMAIYNDLEPNDEFTKERIDKVRQFTSKTKMVEMLGKTYGDAENYTKEVVFFVEQVTGHVIPDFRYALKYGIDAMISEAKSKSGEFYEAATIALGGVKILAERYISLIGEQKNLAANSALKSLNCLKKRLPRFLVRGQKTSMKQFSFIFCFGKLCVLSRRRIHMRFLSEMRTEFLSRTEEIFRVAKQRSFSSTSSYFTMWETGAGQFRRMF